ncbi:MAG: 30S ribosomal protein S7 [Mariprofundaceae bacterium]|nr:30S ribosomal protein S7 [Mariprofundaceae bacterium]
MPRKGPAPRRPVTPDAKYNDILISRVVNKLMWGGKKTTAEAIMYGAIDILVEKNGGEAKDLVAQVVEAIKPQVEVKSRRVGGATYQVPIEITARRQLSLAVRWLVEFARKRSEHTMVERLGYEMVDVLSERGGAMKKRDETHRMAEANKAFSHYRW